MNQNKVNLSLTFTQRLKYKAHYYKMVHSQCGQNLDDDPAYKLDSVVSSVNRELKNHDEVHDDDVC